MLLFKVRRVKSPYCEEFRGWRMALAIDNDSGPDGARTFNRPFLIAESSDFTDYPSQLDILTWIQQNANNEVVSWVE